MGCKIIETTDEERKKLAEWIKTLETKYSVRIYSCSVPGFPKSKCIDGSLLESLHDNGGYINLREAKSRKGCGCDKSIDVGGWPVKKCFSGCDYCYANSMYID